MARAKRLNPTVKDEMLQLVQAWKAMGGKWPVPLHELVDFALETGLYNGRARLRKQCARDLSDAMREDYFKDEHGKPVRKLHAATFTGRNAEGKKTQRTLWGDIDTMDREFMAVAFGQRRRQIVGECKQLSNDIEYRNRKHPEDEPVLTLWDFTDDVKEADEPVEYVPRKG